MFELPFERDERLQEALRKLETLPPLVTSWEIERLREQLVEAELGQRFVLQGGDCAETFADCRSEIIASKVKVLLQMGLVLAFGTKKPITRIGRIAGQYAKPRSARHESRDGLALPNYFGDSVNREEFSATARAPAASLMVEGYMHAASTLNFVRSLTGTGFSDVRHPHQWDLGFLERSDFPEALRERYRKTTQAVLDALGFVRVLGGSGASANARSDSGPRRAEPEQAELFVSHEGLLLEYERCFARNVPRRPHPYLLSTHLPWIGERTRKADGAHVEFFRGLRNPIGVKLGPKTEVAELVALAEKLNPENEQGRVLWITRMGASDLTQLSALAKAAKQRGTAGLWVCDPMHGNTTTTPSGTKTREMRHILAELRETADRLADAGLHLGGIHCELTGEDVTECIGSSVKESELSTRYTTACDPRLNYAQALEIAYEVADKLAAS
jgi:3-deoxy-7-phosphoheptulonate synthase